MIYLFLFHLKKIKMTIISIPRPYDIYFSITIINNPQCIVLNLILSNITGRFLKWCLLARNRINNTTALFEMISTIKVQNKLHSGIGNHSHWLDTLLDCRSLPEAVQFTSDLRPRSPQSSDPWYSYAILYQLLLYNGNYKTSNGAVGWYL